MDFGLNLPVATDPPNVTWLHTSSSNDHPDAWCDRCCNYCGYSNDDHRIANSAKCKFFLSATYHLCVRCIEIIPLASLPGKSGIWGVCGHHKRHGDGWFGRHYFWVAVMVYEMKTSQNADEESGRAQKKNETTVERICLCYRYWSSLVFPSIKSFPFPRSQGWRHP